MIRSHQELEEKVSFLTRELARANHRIRQKHRLEALGEMAAKVAHEIRNPLGGISIYAGMLHQELEGPPRWKEWLSRIEQGLEALNRVVGELLDFTAESTPRPVPLSLPRVLRAAVALAAIPPECEVAWRVPEEENEMVGDPDLLGRVFLNLVRNAVEAMGGKGRLTIELAPGEGEGWSVRFRDSGPGVPPDLAARIFEPFFTTREHGTGLGLPLVVAYLDAHGGTIALSPSEAGACFEVTLPRRPPGDIRLDPEVQRLVTRRAGESGESRHTDH